MAAASLGLGLALVAPTPAGAETVIKIATVAPRGSVWMRYLNKLKAKVLKKTGGEVKLQFYPGQVQGDERDVVRKMRTGQLQGGSFNSVGLSMINREALLLQMPFIVDNYAQMDKLRNALKADFEQSFEKRGYVLLGWTEAGMIHLMTLNKATTLAELRKQRIWVWSDDPISKAVMRKVNINPRLLGLPQVYPALNTGMINAVFNSPLGAMALQWHTKVKYMLSPPLAVAISATVIQKSVFDKLSPEHQKVLKGYSEKYHMALTKRIRALNEQAKGTLRGEGVTEVQFDGKELKTLKRAAAKVAREFAPKYYPVVLLEKALKAR